MSSVHSDISRLRAQYFSLYPPHLISFPAPSLLILSRNQDYLYHSLISADDLEGRVPERNGYQRKFWKKIVAALEEELRLEKAVEMELELDEGIASHFHELLLPTSSNFQIHSIDTERQHNPRARGSGNLAMIEKQLSYLVGFEGNGDGPEPSFKTYLYEIPFRKLTREAGAAETSEKESINRKGKGREHAITLMETQTMIQSGSTGLRTWTASLHLAAMLLRHPKHLFPTSSSIPGSSSPVSIPNLDEIPAVINPRTILELGAGAGFLSIFLAQLLTSQSAEISQMQKDSLEPRGESSVDGGKKVTIWTSDLGEMGERELGREIHEEDGSGSMGERDKEGQEEGKEWDSSLGLESGLRHLEMGERKVPLGMLKRNLELNRNRHSAKIFPIHLDWQDSQPLPIQPTENEVRSRRKLREFADGLAKDLVVVAADVIYDPDLIPPLVSTLCLLLINHPDRSALIAATVRNPTTLEMFREKCLAAGLLLDDVRQEEREEDEDPVFWNANAWEGGDVKVMRLRWTSDGKDGSLNA